MVVLLPVSVLPYATVHHGWRAGLAVLLALAAGPALLRGLGRRRPKLGWWLPAGAFALALALATGSFVPLSAESRSVLAPTIAPHLGGSMALVGVDKAPLALELNRGLQEWALSAALVACLLGLGLLVRDGRRGGRIAWIALGTGLGLLVLAIAHRAVDAPFIWWTSGVPSFSREPFFGTFVNPNHGGLFCAALAPLALCMTLRYEGARRTAGAVIAALLVLGALFAQSRGALLALGAGLLVGGALLDRRVGLVGLCFSALAVIGLVVVGPTEALVALSEFAVPEALDEGQDLVAGRGDVLRDAVLLIQHRPLFGVGPAGFDDAFHMVKRSPAFSYTTHAHLELLQLVAEQGWPATMAWLVGFGAIAVRAFRVAPSLSWRRRLLLAGFGGVAGALACSTMYTFPLRIGALQILGMIAVGSVLGLSGASERTSRRFALAGLLPTGLVLAVLTLARFAPGDAWWGPSEEALEAGLRALDAGDAELADERLRLALRRRPANREALQLLTRTAVQLGDVEGAFQAARAATEVYPTLPWVWRDLARLQRRVGDFDESRDTWRRVLECALPDDQRSQVVAEALLGPGDPVAIVDRVVPDRGDVLILAGRELERVEAMEEAEQRLVRAAELDVRYAAHLAAFLLRAGRAEEALVQAERSDSCFALEIAGNALLKLDRSQEALEHFESSMGCTDDPERGRRLRIGLARARIETGDTRGVQTLESLLQEDPTDVQVLRLLAREARESSHRSRLQEYLSLLVEADAATPREVRELERLEVGLPIQR